MEKKEKDLGTVYHRSLWKDIVSEIKSNPAAILAVIFLTIIIIAALLAPLSPYDPKKLDLANKFAEPSMQHPFGCDVTNTAEIISPVRCTVAESPCWLAFPLCW